MKIQEYVDIKNYCTLKIGGQFRYFAIVKSEDEIKDAIEFAEKNNVNLFMLG